MSVSIIRTAVAVALLVVGIGLVGGPKALGWALIVIGGTTVAQRIAEEVKHGRQ